MHTARDVFLPLTTTRLTLSGSIGVKRLVIQRERIREEAINKEGISEDTVMQSERQVKIVEERGAKRQREEAFRS